jgi:hypothetical protein
MVPRSVPWANKRGQLELKSTNRKRVRIADHIDSPVKPRMMRRLLSRFETKGKQRIVDMKLGEIKRKHMINRKNCQASQIVVNY